MYVIAKVLYDAWLDLSGSGRSGRLGVSTNSSGIHRWYCDIRFSKITKSQIEFSVIITNKKNKNKKQLPGLKYIVADTGLHILIATGPREL
jgi:hypothetical protein